MANWVVGGVVGWRVSFASSFRLIHARRALQLLDTRPLHGQIEWLEARKVVSYLSLREGLLLRH